MPKGIYASVGKNGNNNSRDVKLVQIYLNSHLSQKATSNKLSVDGKIGRNTINAIKQFQTNSVGMSNPDGRIDPNGKTFRYLTMYIGHHEQDKIEGSINAIKGAASSSSDIQTKIRSSSGLQNIQVAYSGIKESRKVVSNYSLNIIKIALKEAGMNFAAITSTLRTPEEQASIMLKNAKKGLSKQYQLYGTKGDSVLKVYENNKSKKDTEVLPLMIKKIQDFAQKNQRVSKHCVSLEDYKKLNIIDIGVNSSRASCKGFNAKKFTAALNDLKKEGYIEKVIDETKKINSCWHIEIIPNKRTIQTEKNSILRPVRLINDWYSIC